MKRTCPIASSLETGALLCVLILALVVSGQSVWAQDNEVKSCARDTPPQLNGIISQGEYVETCQYQLQLNGAYYDNGTLVNPPLGKSMELYIMNDRQNVYLAFQWTHLWNEDLGAQDSSPDKYLLLLAFDFDADGLFEDGDQFVYSIDDGLGLAYLGFDIGNPNPPEDAWIKIYIPVGMYVISWNSTEGAQVIGGPDAIPGTIWKGVTPLSNPGPLDRGGNAVSFPYAVTRSPGGKTSHQMYTYTIELAVPKILFHKSSDLVFDPAGFGFFLTQETNSMCIWTWPSELDDWQWDVNPESAELLGVLGDLLPGSDGFLDPGQDPPSRPSSPVGGVVVSPSKDAVLFPWLAALAVFGTATAAIMARRRKK